MRSWPEYQTLSSLLTMSDVLAVQHVFGELFSDVFAGVWGGVRGGAKQAFGNVWNMFGDAKCPN